jgi:hypothetical protein
MCYLYRQKRLFMLWPLIWIRKLCNIQRNIWIILFSMPDFIEALNVTSSVLNHCWPSTTRRPNGLGVWFLLWVQEVPGSNPGLAHDFFFFFFGCKVVNCNCSNVINLKKVSPKGTLGVEPRTCRTAAGCSTTELYPRVRWNKQTIVVNLNSAFCWRYFLEWEGGSCRKEK